MKYQESLLIPGVNAKVCGLDVIIQIQVNIKAVSITLPIYYTVHYSYPMLFLNVRILSL